MKVAVASSDGRSISDHFGRATCFLVYEIDAGEIRGVETRACSCPTCSEHVCEIMRVGDGSRQLGDYREMVSTLSGCHLVLCRGMGWYAAQMLVRNGINPQVIRGELTPREAVEDYLTGRLTPAAGFCRATGRRGGSADATW